MAQTFYEVLGVDADASQERVEDAYRQRVKETHPDLNDHEGAAEEFKRVRRAEEVLGDPDERARYDRLGHGAYVRHVGGGATTEEPSDPASAADAAQDGDFWTNADWSVGEDRRADADGSYSINFGGDGWEVDDAGGDGGASDGGNAGTSDDGGQGGQRTAESDGGTATGGRRRRATSADTAWRRKKRRERRQSKAERNGGNVGDEPTDGYSVHSWDVDPTPEPTRWLMPTTKENLWLAGLLVVLYPVFVVSSVTPAFSLAANVVVGLCTLLTMGYLLTKPQVAIVVFGVWSVLTPVVVLTWTEWGLFSPLTAFALGVCWIPLGYSIVIARTVGL